MAVLAAPPGPQHARELPRWMVVSHQAAAADGRRGSAKRTGDPDKHQEPSMTKEVPEHIQRHRAGRASAARPGWAGSEFTARKAAGMRVVGVEMASNGGVSARHIKAIASVAGVSVAP